MSGLRARMLTEIELRVAALLQEVAAIDAAAKGNEGGFGIHATQLRVLGIMMDGLCGQQRAFLERLGGDVTDGEFADGAAALLFEQIPGTQRIWRLFSGALAARRRPGGAPCLDAADLAAAEGWDLCMSQARNWSVLDADVLRAPPLVCAEPYPEPLAFGRRALLGVICDAGWRFHDLRLPLPLVLLPADQAECIWMLPALGHEVGHDVDQDLGLTEEIVAALAGSALAPERRALWQRWAAEALADAFGLLLCNAGFVEALAALLLVMVPGSRYRALDPTAAHPHPRIRLLLVGAMLRRLGVPALADRAAALESAVQALPAPEDVAPFLDDVSAVAALILGRELRALGGHALGEINPELAADVQRTELLAAFLASGRLRPSPDRPSRFPVRLVPAAAGLAVAAVGPTADAIAAVQERALAFVGAIPRPTMLGGAPLSAGRAAYLARLARGIDFRRSR
jgi:hypothetical protein